MAWALAEPVAGLALAERLRVATGREPGKVPALGEVKGIILERLVGRIGFGNANARDLIANAGRRQDSVEKLPIGWRQPGGLAYPPWLR